LGGGSIIFIRTAWECYLPKERRGDFKKGVAAQPVGLSLLGSSFPPCRGITKSRKTTKEEVTDKFIKKDAQGMVQKRRFSLPLVLQCWGKKITA